MSFCQKCRVNRPNIKRSACNRLLCSACFAFEFEEEVHEVVIAYKLFEPNQTVCVGVSGGKDSSCLLHLLYVLNNRYNYGIQIVMLAIDEGIKGYRDDSLACVRSAKEKYNLPLQILSFEDLYDGWSMDSIVKTMGPKKNCTYCGTFRRQALDKGAVLVKADMLCTGHNADDAVETILMNYIRGDLTRLRRCGDVVTGRGSSLPRCKPLFFCFEREIVLYCRFLNLEYFSTECLYAPNAYRGQIRTLVKNIESLHPSLLRQCLKNTLMIIWMDQQNSNNPVSEISTAEDNETLCECKNKTINKSHLNKSRAGYSKTVPTACPRCGCASSGSLCQACQLLDLLNMTASTEPNRVKNLDRKKIIIEENG